MRDAHTILVGKNLVSRDHLETLGADGRTMLKWVLKEYDVRMWTGITWLRIGTRIRLLLIW
jgi:hypothetical protein